MECLHVRPPHVVTLATTHWTSAAAASPVPRLRTRSVEVHSEWQDSVPLASGVSDNVVSINVTNMTLESSMSVHHGAHNPTLQWGGVIMTTLYQH